VPLLSVELRISSEWLGRRKVESLHGPRGGVEDDKSIRNNVSKAPGPLFSTGVKAEPVTSSK
jgi:hypothetical protein